MSKDSKDVFGEALKNSIEENINKKPEKPDGDVEVSNDKSIVSLSQDAIALSKTIEGDPWNDLSKYINGAGAQRMIAELHVMSSRDFSRNYIKLLEHFKPKLVRSDSSPEDDIDTDININLTQQLPDGEIRTISLNNTKIEKNE